MNGAPIQAVSYLAAIRQAPLALRYPTFLILPDDETAEEMMATIRDWRGEGGYA